MYHKLLKKNDSTIMNYILIAVLFIIYFLPYLIYGKDSYILVNDNLDQMNMLGIFDKQFKGSFFIGDNIEEYYMPGIDSSFRLGGIYINKLFYWLFGYFWGFVFNEFIYRVIAFCGFIILFKRIKGDHEFPDLLVILLAFSFVSLSFWPQGGLSVAGIPLVIVLFQNLYSNKRDLWSYFFIFLYAFYSGISLSGIFILILIIPSVLVLWIMEKKLPVGVLFGSVLLGIGYVLANTNLFLMQFFYKIPTNRTDMSTPMIGFGKAVEESWKILLYSQEHALSNHLLIIIPSSIALILFFMIKKNKRGTQQYLWYRSKMTVGLFIYLVVAAIIYGFFLYEPFLKVYNKLHLGFNFSRFYFLSPAFWFLLWGIVLLNYYLNAKNKKLAFIIIAILLLGQNLYNYKNFTYGFRKKVSFSKMVSEKQFDEIKKELQIGALDRIGCIGFFPSIANYNGLKTLGGYRSVYALEFKKKFYEIVKKELEKNSDLHQYFVDWGSRAYLFDDEIGFRYSNQDYIKRHIPTISCELNIEKMKEFGVTYLFSTSKITNDKDQKINLLYVSDNPEYYYRFYVYGLD